MKAIILAGGYGTRLSEETILRPKPMVEIGGKPILWHIMKIYSHFGINDFIICLGYKGHIIKDYFLNYYMHNSDITVDLSKDEVEISRLSSEPWRVSLIETGDDTMTGGRLRRVKDQIGDETFCFTYGDGVANVDIKSLVEFHLEMKTIATVTAVNPSARFGALDIDNSNIVKEFQEKPFTQSGWINGGFFVMQPKIFEYIKNDLTIFEKEPLESLSKERQLSAYYHNGFWKPMDTIREKKELETLWNSKQAPWKMWD